MNDAYAFWQAQLDGDNPETTPGTPHVGFYALNRRVTFDDFTKLGRKKRIEHIPEVIAIWQEDGRFLMRIDTARGETRLVMDEMAIDNTFARVCRDALSHDDYLARAADYLGTAMWETAE